MGSLKLLLAADRRVDMKEAFQPEFFGPSAKTCKTFVSRVGREFETREEERKGRRERLNVDF